MGVSAGDFDNDGDEDIFLTHLTQEKNTLYVNDCRGNFLDETTVYGLATPSLPFTGFGTDWFDYDSDGYLDLFAANGAVRRLAAVHGGEFSYDQKNQLFGNKEGKSFEETSLSGGPGFELSEISRGAAFEDVDNDGDIDIVMTNNNGPVRLFLNEVGLKNHWLQVTLKGVAGVEGSRVILLKTDGQVLWRRSKRDGSYLSANDERVHFGLGPQGKVRALLSSGRQAPGSFGKTSGAILTSSCRPAPAVPGHPSSRAESAARRASVYRLSRQECSQNRSPPPRSPTTQIRWNSFIQKPNCGEERNPDTG